jgi:hypothetical protein
MKMVKEHLMKANSAHQRDWDDQLPIFLLAYRAPNHNTTGTTPSSMVFGRELYLPCNVLFGDPPDKEQSVTNYVAILMDQLHDIQHACQHLKVAGDRMKTCYDCLSNSTGFQEGDKVWLYHPSWTR